jgi:hypothetical protein
MIFLLGLWRTIELGLINASAEGFATVFFKEDARQNRALA